VRSFSSPPWWRWYSPPVTAGCRSTTSRSSTCESATFWSAHPPLSGLLSRNGWNHPGPAQFWFTALVSGAFGQPPWATRVSGTLLQIIALGWLLWVTWRQGTRLLLAAASVTAATYLALGSWLFVQPWNLWVPLPWFILFVFLVWIAADGAFGQLIAMSVAGTFLIQTHVGYVPLVLAGFAWVLGCAQWDARRGDPPRQWRRVLAISGAVWVVTWIPVAVDSARHWPGNIGGVLAYFARGASTSVGAWDAAGLMAAEFEPVPDWLGGDVPVNAFTRFADPVSSVWLVIPALLLGLAAVACRTRGDRRAVGFAAVLLAAGTLAIARADQPRGYTFQWRPVVAAFVVVTTVWVIGAAVAPKVAPALRTLAIVAVVGFVAWGSISHTVRIDVDAPVRHHGNEMNDLEQRGPDLDSVMRQLRRAGLLERSGPVLVRAHEGRGLFDGVVNELDREGVDVRVAPGLGEGFGEDRTLRPARAPVVWHVAERRPLVDPLLAVPGAELIAETSPLSREEDAELTRLQRRLVADLRAAGRPALARQVDSPLIGYLAAGTGIDDDVLLRTVMLNRKVSGTRCRCAIVAIPA
jgi:hypothetical protein